MLNICVVVQHDDENRALASQHKGPFRVMGPWLGGETMNVLARYPAAQCAKRRALQGIVVLPETPCTRRHNVPSLRRQISDLF